MTVIEKDVLNLSVEKIRLQIPSLVNIVYLNSRWTGPMPSQALSAMQESFQYQLEVGASSKYEVKAQISEINKTRKKIAEFFNVNPKKFA